eukprot:CAMPEP_0170285252 /NCGR_PEP_ID=MMETSP0116_2-20130129/42672_1 /TAXON_ID=400756 /ORGANISM="Durinskia baltica, Strain CSIRO CS-38" /LENGTH=85 /DNA_ID=CAMNT_0010536647 /DNA_START=48 /DNA_END=305 /DNA_ORIENTATION=+
MVLASLTGTQMRNRSAASNHSDTRTKRIAKNLVLRVLPSFDVCVYQPRSHTAAHSTPASSKVSRAAHDSNDPLSTSSSNFPAGIV